MGIMRKLLSRKSTAATVIKGFAPLLNELPHTPDFYPWQGRDQSTPRWQKCKVCRRHRCAFRYLSSYELQTGIAVAAQVRQALRVCTEAPELALDGRDVQLLARTTWSQVQELSKMQRTSVHQLSVVITGSQAAQCSHGAQYYWSPRPGKVESLLGELVGYSSGTSTCTSQSIGSTLSDDRLCLQTVEEFSHHESVAPYLERVQQLQEEIRAALSTLTELVASMDAKRASGLAVAARAKAEQLALQEGSTLHNLTELARQRAQRLAEEAAIERASIQEISPLAYPEP